MMKQAIKPFDLFRDEKEWGGDPPSSELILSAEKLLLDVSVSYVKILSGYVKAINDSKFKDAVLSKKALKVNLSLEYQNLKRQLALILASFAEYSECSIYQIIFHMDEKLEKNLGKLVKKAYNQGFQTPQEAMKQLNEVIIELSLKFDTEICSGFAKHIFSIAS